jgi:hypothetical protein
MMKVICPCPARVAVPRKMPAIIDHVNCGEDRNNHREARREDTENTEFFSGFSL